MIKLIIGGARSGKTHFAVDSAKKYPPRRIYIATALPIDEEMKKKIEIHKDERGEDFETWEEPINIPSLLDNLSSDIRVLVFDCLTTWTGNILLEGKDPFPLLQEFYNRFLHISHNPTMFIISNEVGMGIVPENKLSREYRDLLGKVNIFTAEQADEVYFMITGIPWRIK